MKTTLALVALLGLVLCGGYVYYDHVNAGSAAYVLPTTSVAPTSGAVSYTLAQVGVHGLATSCWSAIDGNVYDLTAWIDQHPGGKERILSICGKDGSSAFNGQHGNDGRAQAELVSFKIGALAT